MLSPAKSFRDLIVWQKAHEFVLETYNLTKQSPRDERYCLIPQMRRAAISIPANIAEGFRKRGLAVSRLLIAYAQAVERNASRK